MYLLCYITIHYLTMVCLINIDFIIIYQVITVMIKALLILLVAYLKKTTFL